jgi:phosphoribosylglycinamide formyltransferase-1
MADQRVKAAVLLSGSGRTLDNLLARMETGALAMEISAVVSSRDGVRGVEVARSHGLACEVFPRKDYDSVGQHNEAIGAWLADRRPDIIILAGYLCFFIQPDWFTGPVVNIHPALLPKYGGKGFYGDKVHKAVLEAGETETGCTVHLVDGEYDHGRILGQKSVPVLPGDDVDALAARVFEAECELYPEVLARLIADLT